MPNVHIEDGVEFHTSYLVSDKMVQIMEGKLLTLAELLGLPSEQCEALKSEIRQRIWGGTFMKLPLIYGEEMPEILSLVKSIEARRENLHKEIG